METGMADVQNTQTAAITAATPASAAASPTIGQSIDAEVVLVKARLAALEAKGSTDWAAVKARIAKDWPHFVTWVGLAASSAPLVTFVKSLI
jgi:hypothetical protein